MECETGMQTVQNWITFSTRVILKSQKHSGMLCIRFTQKSRKQQKNTESYDMDHEEEDQLQNGTVLAETNISRNKRN